MSKWNQWGMRPGNLLLLRQLLEYVIESGFMPTRMMEADEQYLDLKQAIVL